MKANNKIQGLVNFLAAGTIGLSSLLGTSCTATHVKTSSGQVIELNDMQREALKNFNRMAREVGKLLLYRHEEFVRKNYPWMDTRDFPDRLSDLDKIYIEMHSYGYGSPWGCMNPYPIEPRSK